MTKGISPCPPFNNLPTEIITAPALWDWVLPFSIIKRGSNFNLLNFNIQQRAGIAVVNTYYLNTVSGSDLADGLTPSTPNKTMQHIVVTHGNADRIVLQNGSYVTRIDMLVKPNRSTEYIGQGNAYITNDFVDYIGVWSLTPAQTFTYQCNVVAGEYINGALDSSVLNAYGNSTTYVFRANIAEVEANAGSIWWNGGILYCHPLNNLTPQGRTDIMYYYGTAFAQSADNRTYYFENINIIGGFNYGNNTAVGGAKLYAKNCKFWSSNITGVDECIFENCFGDANGGGDVSNIDIKNGLISRVIEINCNYKNHYLDSTSQASTSHNNCRVVRLNGYYYNGAGSTIAEVLGAWSWNLGSIFHNSSISQTSCYLAGGRMWLDTCRSYNNVTDISNTAGSNTYIHNFNGAGINSILGTLTPY